jgi:hypothetical protein
MAISFYPQFKTPQVPQSITVEQLKKFGNYLADTRQGRLLVTTPEISDSAYIVSAKLLDKLNKPLRQIRKPLLAESFPDKSSLDNLDRLRQAKDAILKSLAQKINPNLIIFGEDLTIPPHKLQEILGITRK